MKTIIGLTGVKTSGKSTVANMIREFVPNVQEVALADKLKNTCAEVFNVPREHFDRQDLKEVPFEDELRLLDIKSITNILNSFGIVATQEIINKYEEKNIIDMELSTPRKIAQIVGTEVLRAAGNDDIHCENVELNGDVVVVSDVRFPNEFNYFNNLAFEQTDTGVNKLRFIPIYVQRDEAEKHINENSHSSETSLFEFADKCIKIDNNGSFRNTELQVKQIIDKELFRYGQS